MSDLHALRLAAIGMTPRYMRRARTWPGYL